MINIEIKEKDYEVFKETNLSVFGFINLFFKNKVVNSITSVATFATILFYLLLMLLPQDRYLNLFCGLVTTYLLLYLVFHYVFICRKHPCVGHTSKVLPLQDFKLAKVKIINDEFNIFKTKFFFILKNE